MLNILEVTLRVEDTDTGDVYDWSFRRRSDGCWWHRVNHLGAAWNGPFNSEKDARNHAGLEVS